MTNEIVSGRTSLHVVPWSAAPLKPLTGRLKQQAFISQSSGVWKFKMRGQHGWARDEGPLLGLYFNMEERERAS